MAYSKNTWVDGTTPVDASRLNSLEGGVESVSNLADELNSKIAYFNSYRITASGADFLTELQGIWENIPTNSTFSVLFQMGQVACAFGYKYNSSYGAVIFLSYSSSTNTQFWRLNSGNWVQRSIAFE